MMRSIVQADRNLAVLNLAQGTRILSGNTDRIPALLGKACIIYDTNLHWLKLGDQLLGQRLPDGDWIPRTGMQELLNGLGIPIFEAGGNRSNRFTFSIQQKPLDVLSTPSSSLTAAKVKREDPLRNGQGDDVLVLTLLPSCPVLYHIPREKQALLNKVALYKPS
jgi:hypothetical protein